MEAKKVIHVHLYEPYEGKSDYFFGSIIAIYSILPDDVVGIKYNYLKAKKLTQYKNKKCVINVDVINRNKRHE